MPGAVRDGLWALARVRSAGTGGVIVVQGAATGPFHVLLDGEAASIHTTATGRTVSSAHWSAPSIVDKITMFTEACHPASVIAQRPSTWCTVPHPALRAALDHCDDAREHVLSVVLASARESRESFVDRAVRSSSARLARWLATNAGPDAEIALPRPQERLALQLGMTRVTLNRALHAIAASGAIETDGSVVTVMDPGRLRNLADL
jgi:CRP-like cAMP-binding protein